MEAIILCIGDIFSQYLGVWGAPKKRGNGYWGEGPNVLFQEGKGLVEEHRDMAG
jgi:hypothetical protein